MTNIKSMEMAETIAACDKISVKKSFFSTRYVYNPTGSVLHGIKRDIASGDLTKIEKLLASPADKVAPLAENLKIERVEVSNVRVDAAVSADSQFAAVQLLRFMDYLYQPVSEVRMFEGPAAQAVCSLLK